MFDMRKIQEQVLFGVVCGNSGEETAKRIVYGENAEAANESDPEWVDAAMERLEQSFDAKTVRTLRMSCQCGYGMDDKVALVNELRKGATCLEEFAGTEMAHAAGLYCENGELFLRFPFCPCPMLEKVKRLKTKTWCQCSAGYSKVLFEKAFGSEFDVEMLKSIKAGDDCCLMKIIPLTDIWGK